MNFEPSDNNEGNNRHNPSGKINKHTPFCLGKCKQSGKIVGKYQGRWLSSTEFEIWLGLQLKSGRIK